MGLLEDIQADQARTRVALANLAADIQNLTAQIVPGMSAAAVQAIKDEGQRIADAAEALAALTPDGMTPASDDLPAAGDQVDRPVTPVNVNTDPI